MLYVTVDGMITESHRCGHDKAATLSTVLGFAMMTVLEVMFT
jgi:zinc transporter ZupT